MRGSWNLDGAGNWEGLPVGGSLFGDAVVDLVWQPGGTGSSYRSTTAAGIAGLIASALASGAVFVRVWMDGSVLNEFVFDAAMGHLSRVAFMTNPAIVVQGQTAIEIADGATCLSLPRYIGIVSEIVVTKTDGPFCTVQANTMGVMETSLGSGIHAEVGADALVEVAGDGFLIIFGYGRIGEQYDPNDQAVVKCLSDDSGVQFDMRDGGTIFEKAVDDGGFSPDISFSATLGCSIWPQADATAYTVSWQSDAVVGSYESMATGITASSSQTLGPGSAFYDIAAGATHTLLNPTLWARTEHTVINAAGSTANVSVVRHDAGAFADGSTSQEVRPGEAITLLAEDSGEIIVRHRSKDPGVIGQLHGFLVTGNNGLQTASVAAGYCRSDDNAADIVKTDATTITMTDTGAGGRDTGAASNGVWHVFVIRNPSTGAVSALASLSSTSPTLPSGYTQKRRVGTLTYVSAAVVGSYMIGNGRTRETRYGGITQSSAALTRVNAGTTTYTDVFAWANYIPDTCHRFTLVSLHFSQANGSYTATAVVGGALSGLYMYLDLNGFPQSARTISEWLYSPGGGGSRATTVAVTATGAGTFTLNFSQTLWAFVAEY